MCGLTCVVALNEQKSRNDHDRKQDISKRLNESFVCQKHRGPDSNGEWISEDGRVGMLAISDEASVY